jgi:prolyl oligopeptidase
MKKLELPDEFATNYINSLEKTRNDFFLTQASFNKPYTLYYFNNGKFEFVRKQKSKFNSDNLVVEQHFATSKDGAKVPYFQVSKKGIKRDGNNPTEVYAYGGFQHSQLPFYSGTLGKHWLEKGGVFVLANIRGGSEYGTKWHKQALKENRQNAFNDFYAVAEDLIARKVSSPKKLAVRGGSNGGLLTAVAMTQRPDLYNAVISAVPLTDMERFHKLLAGHSWVGEYGNPDNEEERKYLLEYSPFHQLRKNEDYPIPFVFTSTLDDRVHPGHARKFVAKMKDLGHPVIYYENTEGGHAGSSNYKQRASIKAMQYLYLYERLGM